MKKFNKFDALRKLQLQNSDVNFAANVILTQHKNPARKLRGLLLIVEAGDNDVSVNRDMRLVINGNLHSWVELEMEPKFLLEQVNGLRLKPQVDSAFDRHVQSFSTKISAPKASQG